MEQNSNSAITIFNTLNDNKIKAYLLFLKYSLNSFNEFNALFQSREVLIHKLANRSESLIKQMGSNFLVPNILSNISIDIINPKNFLPLSSIYLGPECESFLQLQSSEFVSEIKSNCQSFYITALQEMIQRLPYNNEICRELLFLDPNVALREESRLIFPDLRNIATHFQVSDITALAYEWRMLPFVLTDADKINFSTLQIDDMWKNILEKKESYNKPLFPNLEKLVHIVLSLPHSNAEAERIFSIVTDVKSKKRNRIDVSTLDAVCKVRFSFQSNKIDCRSFTVDSDHLQLHNFIKIPNINIEEQSNTNKDKDT